MSNELYFKNLRDLLLHKYTEDFVINMYSCSNLFNYLTYPKIVLSTGNWRVVEKRQGKVILEHYFGKAGWKKANLMRNLTRCPESIRNTLCFYELAHKLGIHTEPKTDPFNITHTTI